jgi:simple sugar transport system substrate-binding protein
MKKKLGLLLWLTAAALPVVMAGGQKAKSGDNAELLALHRKYFPEQARDGVIKIAVVRNLAAGDHTQQFLDGTVSEGRALGFVVDTFVTDSDDVRCQETLAQVIAKDYDGIILSHGQAGYTYDSLKPAVDKGIKVVTFDSVPYKNGDPNGEILTGVTSTAQEDAKLARISLDNIVESFPGKNPVRVIRAWVGPGFPPMDRRQLVYDEYVKAGKIAEATLVGPVDYADMRGGTQNSLAAILPRYPAGTVDAIWGAYDELAKGTLQALEEAGRTDIQLHSIDISNDDIDLMISHPNIWKSTAAVDPKLIGISNIRLLAAKFAGEHTPDTFNLDAQGVKTSDLRPGINMSNIVTVAPNWGQEKGVFDAYQWLKEIKAAAAK